MIKNKNHSADAVLGRTYEHIIGKTLQQITEKFCFEKAVKNYYKFSTQSRKLSVIVNGFFSVKPLRIPRSLWMITNEVYKSRTIISGKKINKKNFYRNLSIFREFIFKEYHGHGYINKIKSIAFLVRSYLSVVKGYHFKKDYSNIDLIKYHMQLLTGCTVDFLETECFGSSFDVDTPYEAYFIKKYFYELKNRHMTS